MSLESPSDSVSVSRRLRSDRRNERLNTLSSCRTNIIGKSSRVNQQELAPVLLGASPGSEHRAHLPHATNGPDDQPKKTLTTRGVDSDGDLPSHAKHGRQLAARFSVRELGPSTWPDFERM